MKKFEPRWDDRDRTIKNHLIIMKVLVWTPWECFDHFWFYQDPVKWCDAEMRAFIFLWKLKNPTFLESGAHVSGLTNTPTCMWKWRKRQTWNFTSFWNYLSFQMWYPTILWARLNTKRITTTSRSKVWKSASGTPTPGGLLLLRGADP